MTDRLKWRYYIISLMSKMNTGKIIVYGVLLVFILPVAVLAVYRKTVSFKICFYAKEYLADTYDFECAVGKVSYNLLQDCSGQAFL